MPTRFIARDAVHDWSEYEGGLIRSPLTSRLLGPVLQGWVEGKYLPLQVPWLAGLWEFRDAGVEKHLERFEGMIGSQALSDLIVDSFRRSSSREASNQSQSFMAEFLAAEELVRAHGSVKKATSYVDWEANGMRVSVKAALGSDFNYERLRNALFGMVLIEENQILRRWGHIRLQGLMGATHRFMGLVLDFMEEDLASRLESVAAAEHVDEELSPCSWCRPSKREPAAKDVQLWIALSRLPGCISVTLETKGSSGQTASSLRISFRRAQPDTLEITTELDEADTPVMPVEQLQALRYKIEEKVALMIEAFKKAPDGFVGWLDLPVHPLHEAYALSCDAFGSMIREAVGQPGFPVQVYVRGGFDLKRPQLLRF